MKTEKIQTLINDSRRSGDKISLVAYQAVLSSIQERENRENITLKEDQVLGVIQKERDAYKENAENTRTVEERDELLQKSSILDKLLPSKIDESSYEGIATDYIKEYNATNMRDMGKVIGAIKKDFGITVDMGKMSGIVKSKLM
jgi:uncharacterized protein YqeY